MTVKLSLAAVPIFQFVPEASLKALGALARVVEKNKGDLVLMQGEPVPGIYLVGEGLAGVHASKPDRLLFHLKPGESFGEMSFLEKAKASATIRAELKATKLILFMNADLTDLVERDPVFGRSIYQGMALALSKKLRTTTAKLATELSASQEILTQLNQSGEAPSERATLVSAVAETHKTITTQLEASLRGIEDLIKRLPDKAGLLQDIDMRLGDLRNQMRSFFPRLEKQVGGMVAFISRIEELIARSSGD